MSAAPLRTPSQPTQPYRTAVRGNLTKSGGEGMALKIQPEVEDMPDEKMSHF
jgi:hypothetical protein